nr:MAG TPA: hypothetical protein [Caudoviricetes sp.]
MKIFSLCNFYVHIKNNVHILLFLSARQAVKFLTCSIL